MAPREADSSFGAFANNHHDKFTYDDRNVVATSKRYNTTDPSQSTNPDTTYDRGIWRDTAGNRDAYQTAADPNAPWITNALNMYASINDPNSRETPVESFSYDDDGNLSQDGSYKYTVDAENRIVEIKPDKDPNDMTGDDEKLLFEYDYLGRRVRKLVYAWDTQSENWSAAASGDLRFIYFDRSLLVEYDGTDSNAVVRKHAWGPASAAARSPLGMLIALEDADSSTDYIAFTNGAGSVTQLVDHSDGSVDATYVYDVSGDSVRSAGSYADDNPLCYRTMYFDGELDYADTTCDGLCADPIGDAYSPRLGRAITAADDALHPDNDSDPSHGHRLSLPPSTGDLPNVGGGQTPGGHHNPKPPTTQSCKLKIISQGGQGTKVTGCSCATGDGGACSPTDWGEAASAFEEAQSDTFCRRGPCQWPCTVDIEWTGQAYSGSIAVSDGQCGSSSGNPKNICCQHRDGKARSCSCIGPT